MVPTGWDQARLCNENETRRNQHVKKTPEIYREAYGNTHFENSKITREMVNRIADEMPLSAGIVPRRQPK